MIDKNTLEKKLENFSDRILGWFLTRNPNYLFIPIALCLFGILYFKQAADLDLFARVAVGRLIWVQKSIPVTDPFAFTLTKPVWYDHEWLSGLVFYGVSQIGGDLALFVLAFVLLLPCLYFLYRAQENLGADPLRSLCWLFLVTIPSMDNRFGIVRSQSFTFLFAALYLFVLTRYKHFNDKKILFLLPAVMIFWANCHAGFVVGLGFVSLFLFSFFFKRRDKVIPLLIILLLCVAAVFVNPYGPKFLSFVLLAIGKDRKDILEWTPFSILSVELFLMLAVSALILFGTVKRGQKIPLEGKLLLILSAYLGLRHRRLMAFFYMAAAVYGTGCFSSFLSFLKEKFTVRYRLWKRSILLVVLAGSLTGFLCFLSLLIQGAHFSLNYKGLPVQAMEWLRENREGGKLLVHFNDGSYALWRGYPRFKVSMDGRYEEVYPDSTVEANDRCYASPYPENEPAMRAIHPDYILLCKESSQGLPATHFGKEWYPIYADSSCQILSKQPNPDGRVGAGSGHPERIWKPLF